MRAVFITAADGGQTGRASRVSAKVVPNRTRVPSVGVMAPSSSMVDAWVSTLWRAALVATEASGSSLLDFEFSLHVTEPVDGPSAELLTATTLTALIRGKKLLPHTTVAGALNPDGSAGPVDEVLPRLRAAALDGVKRFGVPVGGRQQVDASGAVVDVVVEGQRLGVMVKELAGLDDAYLFMTGEVLPRADPATDADMELWPAELAAVARSTAQVRAELDTERPQLDETLEGMPATFSSTWKARLERASQQATDFEKSGDAVRALVVWSSALGTLRVARQDAQLVKSLEARDSVLDVLKAHEAALPLERLELRREIEARFPNTTRANDLYAMDLLESVSTQGTALRAEGFLKTLGELAPGDPTFAPQARKYAEDLLRAREELKNGRRFFAIYASLPKLRKALSALDAERLATSYVAAGAASAALLQRRLGESFKTDETALELAGYRDLLAQEPDARARLVLAARQVIYASYLVNTYAAVGASVDAKGAFSARNTRALAAQIDQARLRVLQSCGRAKRDLAMIPFAARMRYLNARAAREGTDRQKTESIADLWIATWWCELAVGHGR